MLYVPRYFQNGLLNWISLILIEIKKSWFSVIIVFVSNQNCTYILDFINMIIIYHKKGGSELLFKPKNS